MRDQADGCAVLVEFGEQLHYRFAVVRIEISRWFVRHQDEWVTGKRASHSYTLLLTAA